MCVVFRLCHSDDPRHRTVQCLKPCTQVLQIHGQDLGAVGTHAPSCATRTVETACNLIRPSHCPAAMHCIQLTAVCALHFRLCHSHDSHHLTVQCLKLCDLVLNPCGRRCTKLCCQHRVEIQAYAKAKLRELRLLICVLCDRLCHPDDPHHVTVQCLKPCTQVLQPCGHPCTKLCYQECGDCIQPIPSINLSCGHTLHNVPCHRCGLLVSNELQSFVDRL